MRRRRGSTRFVRCSWSARRSSRSVRPGWESRPSSTGSRGVSSCRSATCGATAVADTPRLRELQVWEGDLDTAFSDIAELAAQCRFNDCAHATEPDCAVREALETGALDAERWEN